MKMIDLGIWLFCMFCIAFYLHFAYAVDERLEKVERHQIETLDKIRALQGDYNCESVTEKLVQDCLRNNLPTFCEGLINEKE